MSIQKSLLLIFSLLVLSCGSDIEEETNAEYKTEITLDGAKYAHGHEDGKSILLNQANTFRLGFDLCFVSHDSGILGAGLNGIISVTFENLKVDPECQAALDAFTSDFDSFFTLGERSYYSYSDQTIPNTVTIEFVDENGISWRSLENDQPTESKFEVTAAEDLPSDGTGLKEKKVSGTFNCIVYDENDNQKTITNGLFVHYINDNP